MSRIPITLSEFLSVSYNYMVFTKIYEDDIDHDAPHILCYPFR